MPSADRSKKKPASKGKPEHGLDATIDWLLQEENPSVRFFTLTNLLGLPDRDAQVKEARAAIMKRGAVPQILAHQEEEGNFAAAHRFYTAKYQGTVWQLIVLAELGADGGDERIARACRFILDHSQDPASGGFAVSPSAKLGGGRASEVIPCLTGNTVWSLIRLGQIHNPRVQQGIDWIVRYQRFDDGADKAPAGWPYDRWQMCWGRHSCHMGVVKALKALADIPAAKRSPKASETISAGVEYLLAHHVFKRSHDLAKVAKPGWLRLGFPLMYQTDVLEILEILTRLGSRDPCLQEAVDLVGRKRDDRGRWKLENTFCDRMPVPLERKGQPSKWITLRALLVLKRFCGSVGGAGG